MKITEVKQDLFTVPKDYALVHCISADFAMGAGIAKEFTRRGVKDFIHKKYTALTKPLPVIGISIQTFATDWVCEFNLVTKHKYWQKPTYVKLEQSLIDMKERISRSNEMREELVKEYGLQKPLITKLAMPKIGCGLDKLQYDKVKTIIEDVFADTDIEILVCSI